MVSCRQRDCPCGRGVRAASIARWKGGSDDERPRRGPGAGTRPGGNWCQKITRPRTRGARPAARGTHAVLKRTGRLPRRAGSRLEGDREGGRESAGRPATLVREALNIKAARWGEIDEIEALRSARRGFHARLHIEQAACPVWLGSWGRRRAVARTPGGGPCAAREQAVRVALQLGLGTSTYASVWS